MTARARARSWFALVVSGALAASALIVMPGLAAAAEEPRTFALAGSLQSELGCPGDWQPDCASHRPRSRRAPPASTPPSSRCRPARTSTRSRSTARGTSPTVSTAGRRTSRSRSAATSTLRFVFDDNVHRVGVEVLSLRDGYTARRRRPGRCAGTPGGRRRAVLLRDDRPLRQRRMPPTTPADSPATASATGFDPTDKGFYNGGDLAGLRSKLDYIEGLGTTAIWLTPSFKNKPVQGTGADASAGYHGYWVTDFTQIDPHLGTNAELKDLIDDAHARGHRRLLRHHHEPHRRRHLVPGGAVHVRRQDDEPLPRRRRHGVRPRRRTPGPATFPALDAATSLPVHAGRRAGGAERQGARVAQRRRRCTTTAVTRRIRASRPRTATSRASTT